MYDENNVKIGRTEVDGRTFQLKFWDCNRGLPWVSVSEIVTKPTRKHWFSSETVMTESEVCIDSGWTGRNRLDWAMRRIDQYLQAERDKLQEAREIEAFCKTQ